MFISGKSYFMMSLKAFYMNSESGSHTTKKEKEMGISTAGYNATDLDPVSTFERHVFHRDQFAHYLRWSFVLRRIGRHERVVDFGCGKGNLLETLYRNQHTPAAYFGFDIRTQTIQKTAA